MRGPIVSLCLAVRNQHVALEKYDCPPQAPMNPRTPNSVCGRTEPNFGVRQLAAAFSRADSSALPGSPRRVAADESGDESPHSETSLRRPVVRNAVSASAAGATEPRSPSPPKGQFHARHPRTPR